MYNQIYKVLIVLVVALFGSCALNTGADISVDYGIARRATIHAWGVVYGRPNAFSIAYAKAYTVHERMDVNRFCDDPPCTGCANPNTFDIWVQYRETTDGEPDIHEMLKTAVHEYIHVIGLIESWNADGGHKIKKRWAGPDSVLSIGQNTAIKIYENR